MTKAFRWLDRSLDLRQLRDRCRERLADLRLPESYDFEMLCDHVSTARRREIHRIPVAFGASQPCGMWVATFTADIVFYETYTTKTHQEHIIAHELAHMICCHRGMGSLDEENALLFFPDLPLDLIRDILRRTGYTDNQEREAEFMASMLLEGAARPPLERTWPVPSEVSTVIGRIESSLRRPE